MKRPFQMQMSTVARVEESFEGRTEKRARMRVDRMLSHRDLSLKLIGIVTELLINSYLVEVSVEGFN